jgi:four helix bundle suffix protein
MKKNQNDQSNQSDQSDQSNQSNQSDLSNQSNLNNQSNQSNLNNQSSPTPHSRPSKPEHYFLAQHGHYRHLRVYQVTEIIYDVTFYFTQHYLGKGDRTVDQMVQAARSGKQNIAEGNQAAATSSETEIKLTNVAKASLEELLDDYEDYLRVRSLPQWTKGHPRYEKMRAYARSKEFMETYAVRLPQMDDEMIANLSITLIHQAMSMLQRLLTTMQSRFVTEGGIKERMHQARTGFRQGQDTRLEELEQSVPELQQRLASAEAEAAMWKARYEALCRELQLNPQE